MNQPNIVIVDYGVGNTLSVWNAVRSLDYVNLRISNQHQDILSADVLILPGVGAFDACLKSLRAHHLDDALNIAVLTLKKPILGICIGMQLMADFSEENGLHHGLGWIPGRVVKLKLDQPYLVPHVGWNELAIKCDSPLFSRTGINPHFYFDHSYHFKCDTQFVAATCDYPSPITAALVHNNIYGVQFHPEKSSTNGLKLLRGFFSEVA